METLGSCSACGQEGWWNAPEALGPKIDTLLDGQAAEALESAGVLACVDM